MNNVTHIPAPSVLTQAHRDAMAYIQSLAITVSQQGIYAVFIDYDGNVQWFEVRWRLREEMKSNNYRVKDSYRIELPGPNPYGGHSALPQLQALASELESLLIPPTGDDAA